MTLLARIRTAVRTAFRPQRRPAPLLPPPPISLCVTPELELLHHVADIDERVPDGHTAPGVAMRLSDSSLIGTEELTRRLVGRVAGEPRPDWAEGAHGGPGYGVCLGRVPNAIFFPPFGVLVTPNGEVIQSTAAEALYMTPDLSALPGVTVDEAGAATLQLEGGLVSVPAASIFMAWGGRYNYGHFLLDCLPALMTIAEPGLLDRFPALAPELNPRQRALIALMLGDRGAEVRETSAEVLRIEDALFATPMDHFLHAPAWPLDRVRAEILSRLPEGPAGPKRIYLSRRQDEKRPMLNEAELEAALAALGFVMVDAQALEVADQIALFRDAEVIVGPTGAGFANALFCSPGAKVFEIQPSNFTGIWVRGLCHFVGADWHGFFAASPADEAVAPAESLAPGAGFGWLTPIEDFIDFLRGRL